MPGEVVVTTRPAGYYLEGLETFAHFELLPMQPEEVKDFVTNCFIALSEESEINWDWAEKQMLWIRDHLSRTSEHHSFVRTPLHLSYLVTYPDDQEAQELPQHQTMLYAYYLERLCIACQKHSMQRPQPENLLALDFLLNLRCKAFLSRNLLANLLLRTPGTRSTHIISHDRGATSVFGST